MHHQLTAPSAAAAALRLTATAGQGDQPGPLRVGIATADITPEAPVWLRGFAGRDNVKPSEGIAQRLLAQCALFDNGETRVALVTFDLCGISYDQLLRLRAAAQAAGIPQQHLMVNVSHTHFGPRLGDGGHAQQNGEYEALLAERAQALFAAAAANLQPALLDFTVGSCTMGCSRRRLDEEGKANWGPEPRKPIDLDVPVLRVLDGERQVRALLFGYSCHPTTTGGRLMFLVGSDYPGFAREWVAAAYPGAEPIFVQGCGGDIKPRAVRPGGQRGAVFSHMLLDERESKAAVGYELGRAVVAATAVPPPPVPAGRPAEPEEALKTPVPLGGIAEIVSLPSKADPAVMGHYPWHMGALRIGDLYIFGSQGEVLSAIGMRVKAEMPDLRVWANGYTHWGGGYFAPAAAFPEGGYEVNNMGFAPQAEDILVGSARRLIEELQSTPIHAAPIPRCHP
ncbi:MAG: hypothetical protein HY321_07030 [Armatimonadetes bacterium]|nr:hypothetical protein [Armatimonadota bacterium]